MYESEDSTARKGRKVPSNQQAVVIDGELDKGQPPLNAPDISSTPKNGSAEPSPTGRLSNRSCYLQKPRTMK